jgi:restriction system protein
METCSVCNYVFDDIVNPATTDRSPCPRCGSTARTFHLSAQAAVHSQSATNVTLIINSAPHFSFGAIVKVERKVSNGEIITLVDPIYTYLIDEIKKDSQIIYRIDARRWEEIIAAAYAKAGFDEVILTPRSGDYGIDVIAIKKGFGSVKFIEQVKAYKPEHVVTADEVRALLGVLQADQDASKAIFTTTSAFAPRITQDKFIKPFLPYRLELIDKEKLLERLIRYSS